MFFGGISHSGALGREILYGALPVTAAITAAFWIIGCVWIPLSLCLIGFGVGKLIDDTLAEQEQKRKEYEMEKAEIIRELENLLRK